VSGQAGAGASGGASGGAAGGAGKLRFGTPTRLDELDSPDKDDNPTLTEDLHDIFFTSTRSGDSDVWQAHRDDPEAPFDEPIPVDVVNTDGDDTSPAISLNGKTLWVGEERDNGVGKIDIWFWTRDTLASPWSGPNLADVLSSAEDDIPRPPAMGDRIMPLGSRRQQSRYLTYLAVRPTATGDFSEPELVKELEFPTANTIDGFLTEDGLTLFYSSVVSEDNGDLFYARRARTTDEFSERVPISELNSDSTDERDPWISPNGKHFFFSSNRSGDHAIYESIVTIE
jgi:hypothetical protein